MIEFPISRRRLMAMGGSAALGALAARADIAKAVQLAGAGAVDVRRFGAAGDGARDDSAAFAAALRAGPAVYAPAGIYAVDRVLIPAGRTIITDGFATCFRQRPGTPEGTRLLTVVGSNVRIGDCTVEGNIASDQGEQHHGIFVGANEEVGELHDVVIGNVRGRNLRGDVVYVGSSGGRAARNVRVAQVRGDNILRNVVSVVGGYGISVESVAGSRVGLMHLDIEPDNYNGPVVGCDVGAVYGGFVQASGSSANAYLDQIRIGLLDLRGPVAASSPIFRLSEGRRDALTIRNYRSLEIQQLKISGFAGAAVRQVWTPGSLSEQRLHVVRADLSDCCRDPKAAGAYIIGNPRVTQLHIDDLAIAIGRPGIDAIRDCRQARIDRLHSTLPTGSRLVAQSDSWVRRLLQEAGPAPLLFVPKAIG